MHEHATATHEELRALRALEADEEAREARGELPEPLSVDGEATWALARSSILSELPPTDLEAIARHATRREVCLREEVFLGDASRVWFVESGGVKVLRITEDGRKLIEAVVDAGGFFGSLTTSDEEDEIFAEGLENSVLLAIPQPVLWKAIRGNSEIALSVIQTLDDRQRELSRRVTSLVFKTVEVRVVETILQMCKDYPEKCQHGVALDVRLSQQDLADLVGASRESVSRVISQMQKRDYVHRIGRVLCIPSLSRLQRLGRTYA